MRSTWLLPLCLAALISCTTVDQTGFVIVDGVTKLENKNKKYTSNLFPWETSVERAIDGNNYIIVSNSCGFVEATYQRISVSTFLTTPSRKQSSRWSGLGRMGEWCKIQEFVLEGTHLIRYRNWNGTNFILSSTPIFSDGDNQPFIAFRTFIDDSGLVELTEDISNPGGGTGCYDSESIWYERIHELGSTADFDHQRCFTKGVYLSRIGDAH